MTQVAPGLQCGLSAASTAASAKTMCWPLREAGQNGQVSRASRQIRGVVQKLATVKRAPVQRCAEIHRDLCRERVNANAERFAGL